MQYFNHVRQASHALWNHKRARITMLGTGAMLLTAALSWHVYATIQKQRVPPTLAQTGNGGQSNASGTGFTTVRPVLVSGSSSTIILGSVLSNETANIYPLRDGIVEDIYVDIGDTVRKNQIVALLLPKGVEGLSAAMIAEKQARKSQAESDLRTAEHVAKETIINAQQQIKEKETALLVAEREQEKLLQTFTESEAHIQQMRDQAFTTIQSARQLVEWILLGSNSRTRDFIEEHEVLDNIGRLDANSLSRVSVVSAFNDVLQGEVSYASASKHNQADVLNAVLLQTRGMLDQMLGLLQSTSSAPSSKAVDHFSYEELNDRIEKVIKAQVALYKAKEKIENAHNSFNTLIASEPELYKAYRSGNTNGKMSNKVRTLERQLQRQYNSVALTEANQEQMIERRRTQIDIADAMLQSEYAESGHRQIRSPFAGTISKRFIEVGRIVMPSMPAFELTDVPTSLAQKAKTEIQFGLPEQMIGAIALGDIVTFFLQTDETAPYNATVTRKSPQIDMQTHTITVQAKVSDDLPLPHRASVRVRLTDQNKPVFRLPSSVVKREADRNYVWVVDPSTEEPAQRTVFVIAEDGEFAEITGAITDESAVILDPPVLFLTKEDAPNARR